MEIFEERSIYENIKNGGYDLVINTHGDVDPYYNKILSKKNAITYCHYPLAKSLIEKEDKDYLERYLKITRIYSFFYSSYFLLLSNTFKNTDKDKNIYNIIKKNNNISKIIDLYKNHYLKWLKYIYYNMMKNTTLITNSEYSRKAIFDEYSIQDAIIISPPVDVERFRNFVLLSSCSLKEKKEDDKDTYSYYNNNCEKGTKEDIVIVVSRIDPSKKIDNAIILANLLKNKEIGKGIIIVGNLDPYYHIYYISLKKMVEYFNLKDYVKFEIDASFDKLLLNMKKSKVYFHPRSGEHFGISIVEAMSAGLIPVVADEGEQTEFVPLKYQYNTLEQASQIVAVALNATDEERHQISNSMQKFSVTNYIKNFQQIVKEKIIAKKLI